MDEKICPSCEEPVVEKIPPCPLLCMSPKCKAYNRKPLVNIGNKPVIWVLGGPGSGKSTQCALIQAKYGYKHISCGDLLRAEVKRGSDKSRCFQTVMARGGLVPNDIIIDIIKVAVEKLEPTAKGFVIDGYPREKNQGPVFEKSFTPVTALLYFEVSAETMLARLKEVARSAKVERFDDTAKAMKFRIQSFSENIQQILDLYADKLFTINGEKSIEEVFGLVSRRLDSIANATVSAATSAVPAPSPTS